MKDFFYGIQDLFVDYLFAPYDMLRELQLDSWFGANVVSWLFIAIFAVLFAYWMKQLSLFDPEH
ncbi:uracil phosphoribosyltransferase [Gaetbulibacter sp. M240]|uniref:DUF6341 family protein n=1 Tax=Gaetbulibacter sp. M240 TaxID=3126511 RepID=UPI00374E3F67